MNWISVKDRLPEDDKKVLCYEIGNSISIMTFDLERKQFMPLKGSGRWISKVYVTHWMSLPEPPLEDK